MGFLKKLIKKPISDTKKVVKVGAKLDPIGSKLMSKDPLGSKVLKSAGVGRNPKVASGSVGSPAARQPPRSSNKFTTGQGLAPGPRPFNPTNNAARQTMSNMAAPITPRNRSNKYRIK